MQRIPSDEALTETFKNLIITHKSPMTLGQLQHDYEKLEGKNIPELKLQSLLKYNATFHVIKATAGKPELFDVRYDARKTMNRAKQQAKFNPAHVKKSMKSPVVPRNRYALTNNNNSMKAKNFNEETNHIVDLRQKLTRKDFLPQQPPPIVMPKLTMALSERLKKKGELSPQDIIAANAVKVPDVWYMTAGGSFEKLVKYCQQNKIEPPELKFHDNPLTRGSFKCQVMVDGRVYSAYKDFYNSKQEAQDASCKVAIEELRREEELLQNPLDVSSDAEMMKKIWTMIRSSLGGVFIKHIPKLYIETYRLSLPEDWRQMAQQHEGQLFAFETNAFNEPIIFGISDADFNNTSNGNGDVANNKNSKNVKTSQKIAELEFPWTRNLWSIFVTSAYNTGDICARLIGAEYSDALDRLLTEIEIQMLSDKERPKEILVNHIYLTSISECYHRIRVLDLGEKQAKCVCIDNGDHEWIQFDDIYTCKPEFLTVAPQAFKLSLFGMEDFANDPNVAQQQFFEPLVYKSLVGEIMAEKSSHAAGKAIPMILYDTTTDEDVNLNETLTNSLLKNTPLPVLNTKDNNQVIITHVGDDAIFCQLVKSSVYVQQLINNISKSDLAKYRGLYMDKADKKKVYLVYDEKMKNWYRARLDRLCDGGTHQMHYVDHGTKSLVSVDHIYRLDKISMVLFFYPPQVLRFGLFNVAMSGDVRKRLLALLPTGRQALVKVVTTGAGNLPLVHLFTYISHNEDTIMIKINDQFATALGTELHTFGPNDPLIKLQSRKLKNNGEFINVHVTLVSSPQNFVMLLKDDMTELTQTLFPALQKFCLSTAKLTNVSDVKKSECYAVFDDDSRKWIRASVENVIDADFIHCYCFDSGNFKTLSLDKIRTLPNQFRQLPKLAMKAKLHGVKPKHKDFTPDDAIYFKKLVENSSFPAVIKNIKSDIFDQDLYEIVLFGKEGKIHEVLCQEDRALPI